MRCLVGDAKLRVSGPLVEFFYDRRMVQDVGIEIGHLLYLLSVGNIEDSGQRPGNGSFPVRRS